MTEIFFSIGFAYLIGLALLGYVCLLVSIQHLGKHGRLQKWATTILIAAHFVLGIGAVLFVPAFFYGHLKEILTEGEKITFALIGFVTMGIVFIVVRYWNRVLSQRGRAG
jgi:uncharacterized membrane protein